MKRTAVIFLVLACLPIVATAGQWSADEVVKAHILKNYPWSDIEVQDLTLAEPPPQEPPVYLTVEKAPPGRCSFMLEFGNGMRILATAFVKASDPVVVSARPFRKGYRLEKEDLFVTVMEIGKIPKGTLKDLDEAVGKVLIRSISANTPITDGMIGQSPIIKRGQRVILLIESHGFTVSTHGELKESAMVGSQVKVMNQGSKRVVTGKLIDEKTVKVDF